MKNLLIIAGGLLTLIAMFCPFLYFPGISVSFIGNKGVIAFCILACGLIITIDGCIGRKWLHMMSLLLAVMLTGLAVKYAIETKALDARIGSGIWLLLAGGLLSVTGSVKVLLDKHE